MKLIIDIPDYKLDEVQNGSIASNEILKAVRKGTPISTEGDSISRSELKEAIRKRLGISSLKYLTEQEKVIVEEIDNAPTVLAYSKEDINNAWCNGRNAGYDFANFANKYL